MQFAKFSPSLWAGIMTESLLSSVFNSFGPKRDIGIQMEVYAQVFQSV